MTSIVPTQAMRAGRRGGSRRSGSLRGYLLLLPPMAWLVIAYLGSMAVLLVSAFWSVNSFTNQVVHVFTTGNFGAVLHDPLFRTVTLRTVGVALGVTVIDTVLAGIAQARARLWRRLGPKRDRSHPETRN